LKSHVTLTPDVNESIGASRVTLITLFVDSGNDAFHAPFVSTRFA
jgi:hypothetical protein